MSGSEGAGSAGGDAAVGGQSDLSHETPGSPGDRDRTAEARDRTAATHDVTAEDRDARSVERDHRADLRDQAAGHIDLDAASDRSGARRDRQGAAGDRQSAEADRRAAWTDRLLSANERADQLIDDLTGSLHRRAGLAELERDVIEAHRTHTSFVLAFLDVDHLKATNDEHGHEAGDQLLRDVVESVREVVREYDVIVRYGGDEFLCGLMDVQLAESEKRFRLANAHLEERDHASVSVGLAALRPGEELGDLIARADAAMYARRRQRSSEGPA